MALLLKDKDEFTFRYNQKDYTDLTLYRAKVIGNSVELKWGHNHSVSFSVSEAMKAIDKGRWVIEKEEEKRQEKKESPVVSIKIENKDYHFSILANGEVLAFKTKEIENPEQSYNITYTTITQQEFDAIKKLIDLK